MITQDEIAKLAREYAEEYTRKTYPNVPGHVRERIIEGRLEHMEDFIPWLLRTHCIVSKEKVNEAEDEVLNGWVARDDGERWHERELHLFTRNKPERRKLMGDWIGRPSMTLDSNLFPDLTWDSEPIEVEITIKPKKK